MDREELLKEIFALEPELRAKETEVRALVFSMLEHKPVILSDLAMKAIVKAKLLAQFEISKNSNKYSIDLSWLWYTAPVGIAMILFMLTTPPEGIGQMNPVVPVTPTSNFYKNTPTTPDLDNSHRIDAPTVRNVSSVANKMATPAESENIILPQNQISDNGEVDMLMVSPSSVDFVENSSLVVGVQKLSNQILIDNLTMVNSGYLEVVSVLDGVVVGKTDDLVPGEYLNYLVELDSVLKAGEEYEVVIYEADLIVFSTIFKVSD